MASFDEFKVLALKLKDELARRAADLPEQALQQLAQARNEKAGQRGDHVAAGTTSHRSPPMCGIAA
jgi:hypothetical protein